MCPECSNGTSMEHQRPQHNLHPPRKRPPPDRRKLRRLRLRQPRPRGSDHRRPAKLRRDQEGERPRPRVDFVQDERQRDDQPAGRPIVGDQEHPGGSPDELVRYIA